MNRHDILAKPHWQPFAGSATLLSLSLEELQALDSLVEFTRDHDCVVLTPSDCRIWARMTADIDSLSKAHAAILKTDGPTAPQLAPLNEAYATLTACADFKGISRVARREYKRSISIPDEELPEDWKGHLSKIRNRRDDVHVELAAEALLDDLHVEQP